MTLRGHFIVIGIIIFLIFLGWQVISLRTAQQQAQIDPNSIRLIQISRASWGLNCLEQRRRYGLKQLPQDAFNEGGEGNKIRENNILVAISDLCNGKQTCYLTNSPDTFTPDPDPQCPTKEMVVEYRCYSFDRPWTLKLASREKGTIDCLKPEASSSSPALKPIAPAEGNK